MAWSTLGQSELTVAFQEDKRMTHLPYAMCYAVGLSSYVQSSQMFYDGGRCTPISDVKGSRRPKYDAKHMNPCLYHFCQQRGNLIFAGSLFWRVAEQGSSLRWLEPIHFTTTPESSERWWSWAPRLTAWMWPPKRENHSGSGKCREKLLHVQSIGHAEHK